MESVYILNIGFLRWRGLVEYVLFDDYDDVEYSFFLFNLDFFVICSFLCFFFLVFCICM